MTGPEKPKIEKDGWVVGPKEDHKSVSDILTKKFGESKEGGKSTPERRTERRKRKFPDIESGKTPEELRRDLQREIKEAYEGPKKRGEIKPERPKGKEKIEAIREGLGIRKEEGPKKEEPDKKKKKETFERIKEIVGIPEEELIEYDDLVGDDSPEAWRSRKEELKQGRKEVIAIAAGIESEESQRFFEEILYDKSGKLSKEKEKQKNWKVACGGLMFNHSEWAKDMRDKMWRDEDVGRVRAGRNMKIVEIVGKLLGGRHKSEGWFNFRKVMDKISPLGLYLPGDAVISATGLSVEEKKEIKWWEEAAKLFPGEAILSFWGDSSVNAQLMVEELYKKGGRRLRWAYQRYHKSIKEPFFE